MKTEKREREQTKESVECLDNSKGALMLTVKYVSGLGAGHAFWLPSIPGARNLELTETPILVQNKKERRTTRPQKQGEALLRKAGDAGLTGADCA